MWRKLQERKKARQASQKKVVLPLAASHNGRSKAHISKNRFRDRSKLEREGKLDSFDVAGRFKIR